MKRIFINIFVLIYLTSCLPVDKRYPIWIKNNTNNGIYFFVNNYIDTLLPQTDKYVILINANDKISIDSNQPWEEVFSAEYPKDTLQIFYFNVDSINKYDWNTIRNEYMVMDRRVYSKTYLLNNNWTIIYP